METGREIIYDIKERLGIYSDDSNTSDDHIFKMIVSKRNKLLKYHISNLRREVPFDALQEICMTLSEIKCEDDMKMLISDQQLPGIIESSGKSLIEQIYFDSALTKWINIISYNRIPYLKGSRFAHKQIYVAVSPDRKLVVMNLNNSHIFLEEARMRILASDPERADELSCSTGDSDNCDFYDKPFPCEAGIVDDIKSQIVNELTIKYRVPVDKINDSEDNTDNTGMQLYNRKQPRQQEQQQSQVE